MSLISKVYWAVSLLLVASLVACAPFSPASPGNAVTPDPDEPVSSDDPTPTPVPTPAGDVVEGENAILDSLDVLLMESFPLQASAHIRGSLPDGCTTVKETVVEREGNTFRIRIITARPKDAVCTQALVPFEKNVPLDIYGLKAGEYSVAAQDLSTTFHLDVDNVPAQTETGQAPVVDGVLVESPTGGYSFRIPEKFSPAVPEGPVDVLVQGPFYGEGALAPHAELIIGVQDLPAGEDFESFVRQATNFGETLVKTQEISLGGEHAVYVPEMPGGAAHTGVVFQMHAGKLVILTFQPVSSDQNEQVLADQAQLFESVTTSWAWTP